MIPARFRIERRIQTCRINVCVEGERPRRKGFVGLADAREPGGKATILVSRLLILEWRKTDSEERAQRSRWLQDPKSMLPVAAHHKLFFVWRGREPRTKLYDRTGGVSWSYSGRGDCRWGHTRRRHVWCRTVVSVHPSRKPKVFVSQFSFPYPNSRVVVLQLTRSTRQRKSEIAFLLPFPSGKIRSHIA